MLIPDVNVLLYAYDLQAPNHMKARLWWEETLSGSRSVGLAWVTILGFIRMMTGRSATRTPLTPAQAISRVQAWLDAPYVQIVTPGDRHPQILFELLVELGTAGNLTTDAHLAALALEYSAEIASTDADFSRFPGLRWFNPLKV